MAFADYCRLPGVNWSLLKHMDTSPAHYLHARENKGGYETDPMRLGRATHTLVFEPETYDSLYVVWEQPRNSNAWRAFRDEHAHMTILTADQAARAHAMAEAVRRHSVAAGYLNPRGKAEQTLVWTDEETGLVCKARADFLSHWHAVVDLKTYADLSPRGIERATFQRGYHCQLAHYRAGVMASGIWVTEPKCVIIGVESKAPFDVGVFVLDTESLDIGAAKVAELKAKVKACEDAGEWPGRYPTEQCYSVPEWARQAPELTFEEDSE
jgi:hypothetical protein